jgi:uncharacterized protein
MLNLSLAAVAREPVRIREEVPLDDPLWEGVGFTLRAPLVLDLEARPVGEGVLVRGRFEAQVDTECRRCLEPVPLRVEDTVDLLYEPLSGEEEQELGGEVYPLPLRGDDLDLGPALREQVLLRMPAFVVCSEVCEGLCPQCGVNRNEKTCGCVLDTSGSPWDALKDIKFD